MTRFDFAIYLEQGKKLTVHLFNNTLIYLQCLNMMYGNSVTFTYMSTVWCKPLRSCIKYNLSINMINCIEFLFILSTKIWTNLKNKNQNLKDSIFSPANIRRFSWGACPGPNWLNILGAYAPGLLVPGTQMVLGRILLYHLLSLYYESSHSQLGATCLVGYNSSSSTHGIIGNNTIFSWMENWQNGV